MKEDEVLAFLNNNGHYNTESVLKVISYFIDKSKYKNEKEQMLYLLMTQPTLLLSVIPKIKEKLIDEFKVNSIISNKFIYYYI